MALKERCTHHTVSDLNQGVLGHANRQNIFVVSKAPPPLYIQFELHDGMGEIYLYREYTVTLSDNTVNSGTTDERGYTKRINIRGHDRGILTYGDIRCALCLSESQPEDLICEKSALNALGYGAGLLDGTAGEALKTCISQFQQDNDLTQTGALGGTDKSALKKNHLFDIDPPDQEI